MRLILLKLNLTCLTRYNLIYRHEMFANCYVEHLTKTMPIISSFQMEATILSGNIVEL
jgi:hypothetical protein